MAVKYRNMQQHPRQGSYIRQALTQCLANQRKHDHQNRGEEKSAYRKFGENTI
jgi:hypothetical protein